MKLSAVVLIGVMGGLGAGCAVGSRTPMAAMTAPSTHLDAGRLAPLVAAVPPPPADGSARALADIAASERLRALEDSDRWTLATRHAELRPAVALYHFNCALGARLTAQAAPGLVELLERVLVETDAAAEGAKARFARPRPVAVDPDRRSCQVLSPAARASASYPSGSAAVGAAYGEAFAAMAPDRAAEAREMGRQIGLSRLVCAMHYPSDVEAGTALGRAVFAVLIDDPAFAATLDRARSELEQARSAGRTSPACAAERLALATPLP